ncbi:M61 glycyl aminopeptidase family protein [Asticcacaulis biprosthecium C19]|uniref:M61 glycyl aminopeptidase family protein n=2 Tax=Asticcacaulis biprosthecium TaxID=76891 RepID=F4QHL2_9CAUL|nr:M61 glycyl aminopeptidase family protein [Asticcacaulis biprosthecium C19]
MTGLVLSALWLMALPAAAQVTGPVTYRLRAVTAGENLTALELRVDFRLGADGRAVVDLPSSWGGGSHIYERLKDVRVTGAQSVELSGPESRVITGRPKAKITLSYHLEVNRTAGQGAPADTNFTYPVLAPDGFYITGPGLMPLIRDTDPKDIRFSWTLPQGWQGATNLEHALSTDTTDGVDQSILLAGRNVTVRHVALPTGELRIAATGHFDRFSAEAFDTAVATIVATEQTFWGDGPEHFLVTLAPTERRVDGRSIRGTGLGDAFAIVTAPNTDLTDLKTILAHEYFHTWSPVRLGGLDAGDAESAGYWFSEGFTDFYARRFALESGVIDGDSFVAQWNDVLLAYALSPHRTTPNAIVSEAFWNDPAAHQLPYQRGAILAALLDRRWRAQGRSLDGFMLALRDASRITPGAAPTPAPLLERLNKVALDYGVELDDLVQKHVINGDEILLPAETFGDRFTVVSTCLPAYDLGYDPARSRAAGYFAGVDPDGPAYRAGLRDGMKRIRVDSAGTGDSQDEITVETEGDGGAPLTLRFKPEGKATVCRQRLVRSDDT